MAGPEWPRVVFAVRLNRFVSPRLNRSFAVPIVSTGSVGDIFTVCSVAVAATLLSRPKGPFEIKQTAPLMIPISRDSYGQLIN